MDLLEVRKKLSLGIPLDQIKLKVTDYSRVSTDNILQKNSLKNQSEHFKELIKNNPNWIYINGYIDDGISGTSDKKRDNFMKMIEDAKLGKFDLIITKEISRFSRNTLDSIKYTRLLLSYGVAVYFVNDNINTILQDSELRLTIMASMAQDEIRRLSERVKFGMNRSIKNGNILGNNMLYGYYKINKNTLKINEEESKVVKEIFNLYATSNHSLTSIAKILNNKKIKSKYGNNWNVTTISRIIRNPKYKGYYCAKKSEVIDYMTKKVKYYKQDNWIIYKDHKKIPPIIDEKIWEKANLKLKYNNKKYTNKITHMQNKKYLFSDKIFCEKDNNLFNRRKQNNDISWICSNYLKNGKEKCNSAILKEKELIYIFNDFINKLNINYQKLTEIYLNLYQKYFQINIKKSELLKEKNSIIEKQNKILELLINGIITVKEYSEKKKSYLEKMNVIKNQINNTNKSNLSDVEKYLTNAISQKILNIKIIELLLNKITVNNKNKNNYYLNIYINYSSFNLNKKYYEFNRGSKYSKKYKVKYNVNFIFIESKLLS